MAHVWKKKSGVFFCWQGRVQSQLFGNFTCSGSCLKELRKSGIFFGRQGRVQVSFFGNFTVLAHMWSNQNILTYKFQYLWHVWTLQVSLCCRVVPSQKISLNFNGEISYRALAWRPCLKDGYNKPKCHNLHMFSNFLYLFKELHKQASEFSSRLE